MEQIEKLGYQAVPQVGAAGYFIDIGVKHPDWDYGYIMGVECDGRQYHSSLSARDRDRLRQNILENLDGLFTGFGLQIGLIQEIKKSKGLNRL